MDTLMGPALYRLWTSMPPKYQHCRGIFWVALLFVLLARDRLQELSEKQRMQ